MKIREAQFGRIVFARLPEGDDLLEAVEKAAEQANIRSGLFFLIGTLKKANMGFYLEGEYQPITIAHPLEIISCVGSIAVNQKKKIMVHAHITVSNGEGKAFGGHVLKGCVIAATGELSIIEATGIELKRKLDRKKRLHFLDL